MSRAGVVAVVAAFTAFSHARGDEKLAGIACRSVHLQYAGRPGDAFLNTVVVDRSAPGTYFCVCGFNQGYLGIQELGDGKKVAIFSVWEPGRQDDPKAVPPERRVKLIDRGDSVRVGRFGHEGTGGQSFLDLNWAAGEPYRFLVTSKPERDRAVYTAYVAGPTHKDWRLIAAFSTETSTPALRGYYAFVEDFRRNRESTRHVRRARYGPAWFRDDASGRWSPLSRARFTADSNPSRAIDMGVESDRFFLATGGATANEHTPLNQAATLPPPDAPSAGPQGYPEVP
jgi:hypothetical protein